MYDHNNMVNAICLAPVKWEQPIQVLRQWITLVHAVKAGNHYAPPGVYGVGKKTLLNQNIGDLFNHGAGWVK